ncbi:MAG: SDR family oxidoreductase [Alphaproteobacteria bacterium]
MRILVAGGTTDAGRGICRRLVGAGWRVAIGGEAVKAEALAHSLGPNAMATPGDAASPEQAAALVAAASARLGGIDGLVVCQQGRAPGRILDVTLDDWNAAVEASPRSLFMLVRAAHAQLKETRGAIVAVGTAEALAPAPGNRITSALLAGSVHLARVLALELAADGIRVNTVSTGRLGEPGTADNEIPIGHRIAPEDVGGAVLFLLGPAASYISGQNVVVDGGMVDGFCGPVAPVGRNGLPCA